MFSDEIITSDIGPHIPNIFNYFVFGFFGFDKKVEQSIILLSHHEDIAIKVLKEYGNLSHEEIIKASKEDDLYKIVEQTNIKDINKYLKNLCFKIDEENTNKLTLKKND